MNPLRDTPCRWPLLWVLLLSYMASSAHALDPNSTEPITIESDSVVFDDQNGYSKYQGNVIIRQGDSRLEAEEITVKVANRQIVSIEALGKPAHFVETDAKKVETHGYANTIEYISETALLTLQRNARLLQDDHSFSGDTILYDARRKSIRASGNKQVGERVKIRFQPSASNRSTTSTDAPAPESADAEPKKDKDDIDSNGQEPTPTP